MMEELMKIMLDGAQQQQRPQQQQRGGAGGDILMEILKGAMGGEQAPARPQQQQPQNMLDIADLIGGVLGAGSTGSSGMAGQMNPLLAPIANSISKRLGLSPQITQIILSFAVAALLNRGKKQVTQRGRGGRQQTQETYDLDDLLEGDFAWDSGMAQQISAKTGLSEDEAAYNLQEAMMMLSDHPLFGKKSKSAAPKAQASPSQLDHLLDSWQVDG
ncbi:MAG: hypothetical protein AAF490_07345 [Chloroflexota bacterium]